MEKEISGQWGIFMENFSDRKIILTLVHYYEPGYKAGGPITTIKNSIDYLNDRFIFKVVTSDRDLGDTQPYPLPLNQWISGIPDIIYLSRDRGQKLFRILRETDYDTLYLNSFFSFSYSILPLLWLKLRGGSLGKQIIVAPRGEFSKGALSLKPFKKKLFISLSKLFKIYRNVLWQASSEDEKLDIARIHGINARIIIAPDLTSRSNWNSYIREKIEGKLKIVFLSRISRMKNLDFALDTLRHIQGDVVFHIYGPIEDAQYWEVCKKVIEELPANITVAYKGAVSHDEVRMTLGQYDLFYLPTLGENFGHAIFEALQSGCPVLLSDRTPWNGISANGGGVVIPLEESAAFTQCIQSFIDMKSEEYEIFGRNALEFSHNYMKDSSVIQANLSLFEDNGSERGS